MGLSDGLSILHHENSTQLRTKWVNNQFIGDFCRSLSENGLKDHLAQIVELICAHPDELGCRQGCIAQ